MRFDIKHIFAGGAISAILLFAVGCGQSGKTEELSPEATVEAFCRQLAGGDFEGASSFCDTTAMKDYIDAYAQAWEMQNKEDSCITAIAAGILAEAEITVNEVSRDGGRRIVSYTIKAGEGLSKDKKAVLKNEEGEWRVEKITDGN